MNDTKRGGRSSGGSWLRTGLIVAGIATVGLAAAYLAGSLPARRAQTDAEAQVAALEQQLAAADARVRAGEILGRILTVKEAAMRQNFGQALDLSSGFFDAVRTEAAATPDDALREGLSEILARRDAVTAALAKGDAAAVDSLHQIELRLRRALGYSISAPPPELPKG